MECLGYMSWALKGNHLRVYPVPTKENYTHKVELDTQLLVKHYRNGRIEATRMSQK